MEKKRNFKESLKKGLSSKYLRRGSYSMGLVVIVTAVVIVLNMVVGALPSKYREFDITGQKLTEIGDQTMEVLNQLDTEVNLYLVASGGQENETIQKLLERYGEASDNIHVEVKDPVKSPAFLEKYKDATFYMNSVIVESGERYRVLSPNQIFMQEMDYNTGGYTTTGFDGEGQITSAISYVTSEDLGKVYMLAGHNELERSETLTSLLEKQNLAIEDLNLITADAVPEDAEFLFIFSPEKDITDTEVEKINDYLAAGGHAFIVDSYVGEVERPNLDKILEGYGLDVVDGIIVENDTNHYTGDGQAYLVPAMEDHEITASLKTFVLSPGSQGIRELEGHRDSLLISPLLTTSESSYSKANSANPETLEKEEGDVDGPFMIAAAVTETIGSGEEESGDEDAEGAESNPAQTKIVVMTSDMVFNESINSVVGGGNYDFIGSAITWLSDTEVNSSIPSKEINNSSLTLTAMNLIILGGLAVVVIPVAVIVIGLIIWIRRKKR